MADPNALEGKTPGQTFSDIFHLNNSNNGLDATMRTIYMGNGIATTLQISTSGFAADCNYKTITRPTFVRPSQKATSISHTSNALRSISLATAQTFNITLSGNIQGLSISGLPLSDGVERSIEITFLITQSGSGGHTVTWPGATRWAGGSAPTLTATSGKTDIIRLLTVNNGTTWFGYVVAQNL